MKIEKLPRWFGMGSLASLSDLWISIQDAHPAALITVGYLLIILGLPLFFIVLPLLFRTSDGLPLISARRGLVYAVVFGWAFLTIWAANYDKPLAVAKIAAAGGNPYDGMGGAAGLLCGWLVMLIGVVPALTIRAVVSSLRSRARHSQAT